VALSTRGDYDLWQVVDRQGTRLALDEELVSVTTAGGDTSFALAETAVMAGATRVVRQRQTYVHDALHAFLRRWIYRDQTLLDLGRPVLWGTLALVLGGVIGAWAQAVVDARRWRAPLWPQSARFVILDQVERLSGAPAPPLPVASPPLPQGLLSSAAPRPSTSTSARATADASGRPALPSAPSGSWPGPFFQ
jgi:hypothetical protein